MTRTIINVIARNPSHVHVRVFSGDNTLAKNGDLQFSPEEWEYFRRALSYGIQMGKYDAIQINDDTTSEPHDIT